MEKKVKMCAYEGCQDPTNRHPSAKYCWKHSKQANYDSSVKSQIKINERKAALKSK